MVFQILFFFGVATCAVLALLVLYPLIVKLISLLPDHVTASPLFGFLGSCAVIGLVLLGFAWLLR